MDLSIETRRTMVQLFLRWVGLYARRTGKIGADPT